jgi:hypothetical protein
MLSSAAPAAAGGCCDGAPGFGVLPLDVPPALPPPDVPAELLLPDVPPALPPLPPPAPEFIRTHVESSVY